MDWLYALLLLVLNTLSLALDVLGLPGNWLMVLSTCVVAWLRREMFSTGVLVAVVVLALAGEVLELLAAAAGSRSAGGSWRGSAGALLGGIAGGIIGTFTIPMPVVGSLLGACLGAFLGAIGGELMAGRPLEPAIQVGRGAFVGRLLGTLYKLAVGAAIWATVLVASVV